VTNQIQLNAQVFTMICPSIRQWKINLSIRIVLFALSLLLTVKPVVAAEIININMNFGIIFSDLSDTEAKRYDVVAVKLNNGDEVFLQVLEVSPVLTKLGVMRTGSHKTDMNLLKDIKIGNHVRNLEANKTNSDQDKTRDTMNISAVPAGYGQELKVLQQQVDLLTQQNIRLTTEVNMLNEENMFLKNQITTLRAEGCASPEAYSQNQTGDRCFERVEVYQLTIKELKDRLNRLQILIEGRKDYEVQ
jgi:hypothetical protein